VLVAEPGWRRAVAQPDRLVRRVLRSLGSNALVVLADDRTVRRLNARFRGRDTPTNVLSFQAPHGAGDVPGELVVALGVVRREARATRRSVRGHLAHLVAHGVLHLAGHDHHGVSEARAMEMAEARALARIGLANPWRPR
jgi:probable rRNA maturation factor